jgi:RNA polymerase sigma factor (TIGR02999 family)
MNYPNRHQRTATKAIRRTWRVGWGAVPVDRSPDITRLLKDLARGDKVAERELIPLVYDDLRRMAGRYMRGESPGQTLQTTALVHESYLRLTRTAHVDWQDRKHFFAVAATVMRRVLVDAARARQSGRRSATIVPLEGYDPPADLIGDPDLVLALNDALDELATLDARQSRIVELRYFAGMTNEETADALGISPRTVKREWTLARAWLYGKLAT